MIALLVREFMVGVVYPILMNLLKKGDEDPEFRRSLGVIFAEWSASSSTPERRKALRDLHAINKT